MDFTEKMLKNNRKWADQKVKSDATFFEEMAKGQSPSVLWIGCADSRVPATDVTGTGAGDLFVHRNVANLVIHSDVNLMTVLEYAVSHLKIPHIVVCGHYGCGGVQAAMSHDDLGIINHWVRSIKDVYHQHREELEALNDDKSRFDRLVELNVVEQAQDLAQTSSVQKAWKRGQELTIHSWVFDLASGKIKDLEGDIQSADGVGEIYRFDI